MQSSQGMLGGRGRQRDREGEKGKRESPKAGRKRARELVTKYGREREDCTTREIIRRDEDNRHREHCGGGTRACRKVEAGRVARYTVGGQLGVGGDSCAPGAHTAIYRDDHLLEEVLVTAAAGKGARLGNSERGRSSLRK